MPTPCIDVAHFVRSSGSPALLSLVCRAFLSQLPAWQAAFDEAGRLGDHQALGELLHKMKGCCYAVSALDAARDFEHAEHALGTRTPGQWPSMAADLSALVARMGKEATTLTRLPDDVSAT